MLVNEGHRGSGFEGHNYYIFFQWRRIKIHRTSIAASYFDVKRRNTMVLSPHQMKFPDILVDWLDLAT